MVIRVDRDSLRWFSVFDGHKTSISNLAYELEGSKAKMIRYTSIKSCVLVPEERLVRVESEDRRVGPLNFVCDNADKLRDAILTMGRFSPESALASGSARARIGQAEVEGPDEVFDPEEFQWLCGEFYRFVTSHHMKFREHINIGSVSDLLASREASAAVLKEKLEGRLNLWLPLVYLISNFPGAIVAGAIGEGIVTHKVREHVRSFIRGRYIHAPKHGRLYFKLRNTSSAPIYYYNGNHFGIVNLPECKHGPGLFQVGHSNDEVDEKPISPASKS